MDDDGVIDASPGCVISIDRAIEKCDTCGKHYSVFALDFSISDYVNGISQKEIGKWIKGKHYRICYPCFMKKMGWK